VSNNEYPEHILLTSEMLYSKRKSMSEETREQETTSEKESGRLEAFSDGVFAVAITLLVFDLKVPPSIGITTPQQLAKLLFDQWPSYFTFFISFATILIMWVSHHSMFKLIHKTSTLSITTQDTYP